MADTMSAHHPESEGSSDASRSERIRNGNTITCSICQAVYAPVQIYEYLQRAPRMALESAFMSMCHFCFRCRRPACPNCWDYVHGVCGACTLEAKLPFRAPSTPLQGVVFPPLRQAQPRYNRALHTRLTCIHPGKFQNSVSIDSVEKTSARTSATQNALQSLHIPAPLPIAKDTQQRPVRIAPPTRTRAGTSSIGVDIDTITTQPERRNTTPIDEIITRPEPDPDTDIDRIATKPERHRADHIDDLITRPRQRTTIARLAERLLITTLLLLLFCIALLITLAELFQTANALILQLIHIDIRAEVAYILLLIRQAFF